MRLPGLLTLTAVIAALCGAILPLSSPRSAAAAGQLTAVTGTLQRAVGAARPGDTLVLEPRAYAEKVKIAVSGEAGAPITIRGAGVGASTIVGSLQVEGAHIVIEDLTVDANGGSDDAIRLSAPARSVEIRRVRLHNGTGYGVRVGNDVAGALIEQCVIENFDAGDRDAHGVGIMTASDVTVRGCDISATSGDAIQVNTPDYPGYGRAAQNITIEGNRLHNTRENAVDIKSTHGLTMHGNLAWGFRAVESSDGMAIQVQYDARNITITGNQIWAAVEGIEVSRGVKNGTAYPLAPSGVLIAGNLIRELVADPAGDSGSGSGIVVRSSSAVRVYNNTVLGAPNAGLYVSTSRSGEYPERLDIRNNLLEGAASDLNFAFAPALAAGLVVDANHYVSGQVSGRSLSEWRGAGFERAPTSGAPGLDAAGLPVDGSPVRDSGVDVGLPFKGAAPDRGWGELEGALERPALTNVVYLPLVRKR